LANEARLCILPIQPAVHGRAKDLLPVQQDPKDLQRFIEVARQHQAQAGQASS
jgi:hypothetical protein